MALDLDEHITIRRDIDTYNLFIGTDYWGDGKISYQPIENTAWKQSMEKAGIKPEFHFGTEEEARVGKQKIYEFIYNYWLNAYKHAGRDYKTRHKK